MSSWQACTADQLAASCCAWLRPRYRAWASHSLVQCSGSQLPLLQVQLTHVVDGACRRHQQRRSSACNQTMPHATCCHEQVCSLCMSLPLLGHKTAAWGVQSARRKCGRRNHWQVAGTCSSALSPLSGSRRRPQTGTERPILAQILAACLHAIHASGVAPPAPRWQHLTQAGSNPVAVLHASLHRPGPSG